MHCSFNSLLLGLALACIMDVYPMRKDDQEPPNKNTFNEHFKNFTLKKTSKKVAQKPPEKTEQTDLEKHLHALKIKPHTGCKLKELLVEPKTDLQKKMEKSRLRFAVIENNVDNVHQLLMSCDDPNAMNSRDRKTTLHLAAQLGHTQIIELLLKNPLIDRDPTDTSRHTPLCYSLFKNDVASLRSLLEHRCWVGPDMARNNVLHGVISANHLEALITLLIHPIDPVISINPQDQRLFLDDLMNPLPDDTLQTFCLLEIMRLAKKGILTADCALLAKLWGSPFTFRLSDDCCEQLTRHMNFNMARSLVKSFPENEREPLATALACHYAQRHLINLQLLVEGISNNNQTPHEMAVALNRAPLMVTLVDPDKYLLEIHTLLLKLEKLKARLKENPAQQEPLEMFTQLFIYRLLD